MTAHVFIEAREGVGNSAVVHRAEGDTFDECLAELLRLRAKPTPALLAKPVEADGEAAT